MKKLGLLGGLSWVSTAEYYRLINEEVNRRLGGLHYAECVVYSLNFDEIQHRGWDDWQHTLQVLTRAGAHLKSAGCDALVLCANTAHAVADEVAAHVGLPLIHIASATAAEIRRRDIWTVGLIGTRFTMELPFYRDKLLAHGVKAIVPLEQATRDFLQETVRDELGRGIAHEHTKLAYVKIIQQLIDRGAEGIVLGCTEIPLLIGQADVAVPVFDTTKIHAHAAVDFALR